MKKSIGALSVLALLITSIAIHRARGGSRDPDHPTERTSVHRRDTGDGVLPATVTVSGGPPASPTGPVEPWIRPPRPPGPGAAGPLHNREAIIPPQCYTRTDGTHNPCYVCHQAAIEGDGHENRIQDGWLQGQYGFTDFALTNRWTNLFVDRSAEVAAIPDETIDAYVAQDNYARLVERMKRTTDFRGWKPDLDGLGGGASAFDENGLARDGSWWVAFNYMPMPSTFWPTNGSTDDVMIRLPAAFRTNATGRVSSDVYFANLAILEAAIKNAESMTMPAVSETEVGVDLDGNGRLGRATRVVRPAHYVGRASDVPVETFLFPEGTEFLHTVRYVGFDDAGHVVPTTHMKEVRYMIKYSFIPKHALVSLYDNEIQEKIEGNPPYFGDFRDRGVDTGFGWMVQGYLEDANGELRPSTYEENLFCMGCHSTIGTTIDHTFSFGRKVDGERGFGYVDLVGMPDAPSFGETEGQILTYLRRVGGGSEFRSNDEMRARWFRDDGSVDEAAVRAAPDVHALITPSRERARALNKAYRVIVMEQSFLRGRDATIRPPAEVFETVDPEVPPLPPDRHHRWDIRIAWPGD